MIYSPELYIHDLDRKTFNALNKFPKLLKLVESYNANFNEKVYKIKYLNDAIRLSEKQMPEVYNQLPPVCEKLGIPIPELYYVNDNKTMNAATIGTVNPVMYVTSGLVNKMPKELLSSVFAHECGHIACKHSLYHSIAGYLINGIENSPLAAIPAIRKYLDPALVRALLFWDRCSELSADRAAVLCDENHETTIDVLLRVHGYNKNVNREEFLKQALDLEQFVKDSKSNALIEQMLIQDDSHPRLATRVYECYEWSKSERYRGILDGTFTLASLQPNVTDKQEEKVVEASVEVKTNNNIDVNEINAKLSAVNKELERYTCEADKADYALSIASGIIFGAMDALIIGETFVDGGDIALSKKATNNFVQKYANIRGIGRDRLKDAISELEKAFPVAQDNTWSGLDIGVSAKNHHLADLAHHPTPIGLASALIVQFLRIGTFVNKDGEWHFKIVKTGWDDIKEILIPAVITGILNWLVSISESKLEDNGEELPEGIKNLARIIASSPMIYEIVKCADNWFGHLVSDMDGSGDTAGKGMGIPGVFISLLYEISSLPLFKNTGMNKAIDHIYQNKGDLRKEVAYISAGSKQAIPVILNDLYIRLTYFITHLLLEIDTNGIGNIHWNKVIPFRNRTVDRMIMISSMTFTIADTTDAAVHAAIESNGNWAIFAGRFVSRFNYVGAGKAALSIVKEISNEDKECQLIHEKMLLTHIKTEQFIAEYQEYKKKLDQKLAEFIAQDIQTFIESFDDINEGILKGNSDLVISGNVNIQRVLGREPQFTNQIEFDSLMDSDEALKL